LFLVRAGAGLERGTFHNPTPSQLFLSSSQALVLTKGMFIYHGLEEN